MGKISTPQAVSTPRKLEAKAMAEDDASVAVVGSSSFPVGGSTYPYESNGMLHAISGASFTPPQS